MCECYIFICFPPYFKARVHNSGPQGPLAEFSFNSNQIHLNKQMVFGVTRKLQAGEFDQGWS